MKAAVCTNNGNEVNLHFGMTETFYIYEMEESNIAQLEYRFVERYSNGYSNSEYEFQFDKLNNIYDSLKDCKFLFTAKINDALKTALNSKGLRVVECNALVSKLPELLLT